ncbi:MAG TPA: LLM class F420-dependent oxidoreductase [Acidimicrobiales bacterium]
MLFGVLPPYRAGVAADPDWMVGFARSVEDCGFESLYVVEHVAVKEGYAATYPYAESGRMPLPDDCPIPDPLDLLAFLAAHTRRIVLATGVLVLPEHQALPLAKRLATIDVLSGGRMRLGIGVGWMREELESVGIDFATRGARTDELIQALRLIWASEVANFHGRHIRFDGMISRPQPVGLAGVPIHIGGHSPAAARRAGRLGDGFQPLGLDDETLTDRLRLLWETAVSEGRDPDAIELSLGGLLDTVDAEAIAKAEQFGATRLVLSTRDGDLDVVRGQLESFAQRFLP